MKQNSSKLLTEKTAATTCACCEKLGINGIVQWLADEDARADVRKLQNTKKNLNNRDNHEF